MMKMHRAGRGQTLVEYALMLPLMILIVVMLVDAGRAVYYFSVIHNAAREGARWGIITPEDTTGIEAAARANAVGLDPAALIIGINQTWNAAGTKIVRISVTATYSFTPVTPLVSNFLSGGMLTLQSQSTMNVEG